LCFDLEKHWTYRPQKLRDEKTSGHHQRPRSPPPPASFSPREMVQWMVQKDDKKNCKDTQVAEDAKELPELPSQMASRKCLRIQSNRATLCNEASVGEAWRRPMVIPPVSISTFKRDRGTGGFNALQISRYLVYRVASLRMSIQSYEETYSVLQCLFYGGSRGVKSSPSSPSHSPTSAALATRAG